jgi:carboxyl-terminal processing protease
MEPVKDTPDHDAYSHQFPVLFDPTPTLMSSWISSLNLIARRSVVLAGSLVFSFFLLMNPMPSQSTSLLSSSPKMVAWASSYGSMSDEQKVVAEAWRLVDNSFLDRTFNHQDWFALRQKYVNRKYQNMDEAHSAISTMVASLGDKYTRYLSPAQYQSLVDSATGTLAGIGIEIAVDPDQPGRIVAADVQEASPALAAGIAPGDVFVQVDGVSFESLNAAVPPTPDDVAVLLRGPVNSKVGVVMERNGRRFDYILQRKPITITAVQSYLATTGSAGGGKVGVIRIKNFSGTTASTVTTAVTKLRSQGATAYLMDLRGNPGGLLPGGVDTAGLFLEADAPVVFVVNKAGIVDAQATYTTGIDTTTPMVVLVDANTASAAEVFCAALQENKRATVVGQQTFGKGIVQTIRELSGGRNGGIAITVARYETPLHHNINQQGIPVDVKTTVDCAKTDATACLKDANPSALFRKTI